MTLGFKKVEQVLNLEADCNLRFLKGWCHQNDVIIEELVIMLHHRRPCICHCKLHCVTYLALEVIEEE